MTWRISYSIKLAKSYGKFNCGAIYIVCFSFVDRFLPEIFNFYKFEEIEKSFSSVTFGNESLSLMTLYQAWKLHF